MKTLYCGRFRRLQEQFIHDVSLQRRGDPLSPLDVLVSGQLQRLSLRRELARAGCSHANVRFLTLNEWARLLATPSLRQRKLRVIHDVARGPLMKRAIELFPRLTYFSQIATRDGFRTALWLTLDNLRGAGITLEMMDRARKRTQGSSAETLAAKLTDLTAIWSALDRLMKSHGFVDRSSLFELATENGHASSTKHPLLLYGPSELTELERRFLETVMSDRDVSVYLPYEDSPAFAWTKPIFEWFRGDGFDLTTLRHDDSGNSRLERIQSRLFANDSGKRSDTEDSSLLVIAAPSREREVTELARETLFPSHTASNPTPRMAVVLRESDPYAGLLRDGFSRAGLQGYFHECRTLGDTPSGRAVRHLALLLDGTFKRGDVMEFLLSSPVKWPDALSQNAPIIPAVEWNHLSLLAGISSGEESFTDGLRRLHNQFEYERKRAEEDVASRSESEGRPASLIAFSGYVQHLFGLLRQIRELRTWQPKCEEFCRLVEQLLDSDSDLEAITEEIMRGADLDAIGLAAESDTFRSLLATVLRTPVAREGRFEANQPAVATMRAALGVTFDVIMIPGLVEKELPRSTPQDPLLLDDERKLLQSFAEFRSVKVPLHDRDHERESFLFAATVGSAKERLVVSYPFRDDSGSRDKLASTYLLKTIEAATGEPTDYEALDQFVARSASSRRLPVSRLRMNVPECAVTEFEFETMALGRALRERSASPIAHLVRDHPLFSRALIAETARFQEKEFTSFDGLLRDPLLLNRLSEQTRGPDAAFSPTRMEKYALCPFQFFALNMLKLTEIEEAADIEQVEPMARGTLVHEILERFFKQEHANDRLPLQAEAWPRLDAMARQCFAGFERQNVTGVHLLWQIERQKILDMLRKLFDRERDDSSGFIPRYFETWFEFRYGGEDGVTLRGKMDRMDIHPDGPARVVDYKTGSVPAGMKDGSLNGGRALQLPLYRLAAEESFNVTADIAAYYYLSSNTKRSQVTYTSKDWSTGESRFAEVVKIIVNGIRLGRYFPAPETEKCKRCPVRSTCGAGRLTPKAGLEQESTRDYRALAGTDA